MHGPFLDLVDVSIHQSGELENIGSGEVKVVNMSQHLIVRAVLDWTSG